MQRKCRAGASSVSGLQGRFGRGPPPYEARTSRWESERVIGKPVTTQVLVTLGSSNLEGVSSGSLV
eukprot:9483920-Pyramimonas_sp.AAC.3